jgi:hypothetical protein
MTETYPMASSHPITPPPELVEELQDLGNLDAIALAYRAGADQELEACCEVLAEKCFEGQANLLRGWRRPKPPSLKEQALEELEHVPVDPEGGITYSGLDLIRRALEALPDD